MIRSPRTSEEEGGSLNLFDDGVSFVIQYSGVLPTSASGELWDLDNAESYVVEALDADEVVIDSLFLISGSRTPLNPVVPIPPGLPVPGAPPGITANGMDTLFEFNNIGEISFIRITAPVPGISSPAMVGFAFDNFNVTGVREPNQTVPEPCSLLGLFVIGSLGIGYPFKRRKWR